MKREGNYGIDELDNMTPGDKSIYMMLLQEDIKEQIERQKRNGYG